MEEFHAIKNLDEVFKMKLFPAITYWNRLEGRPRSVNFDRALKAEIKDALWMITKQWQMGEFKGDDAGSPIKAKVHTHITKLTKYQPADYSVETFDEDIPLEAEVEKLTVPFFYERKPISLDIRSMMGRYFLKLINEQPNEIKQQFKDKFPIEEPDPLNKEDAYICAHVEEWQQFSALAGRCVDGGKLYFFLKKNGVELIHDGIIGLSLSQRSELEEKGEQFIQWFDKFFLQPTEEDQNAWKPSHLEYQFRCSSPVDGKSKVFGAKEFYHGKLDWFSLDIDLNTQIRRIEQEENTNEKTKTEYTITKSFIPSPISFKGMPDNRWWGFEDRKANFGDISPDTTDLGKLLVIQFGLVYANDWFVIPFTLPVGSIAEVKGLTVTNTFNERTWIEPSGKGNDEDWQRWNMYTLNIQGDNKVAADRSTILLPTTPDNQESQPIEEILLIRDEMANMVWGIEKLVPLPSGRTKRGSEAGIETFNHLKKVLEHSLGTGTLKPKEVEYKADIKFQLMTSVPLHWIPFINVHVAGSNREIQLQRAGMPLIIEGDPEPPQKIVPRTSLNYGREKLPMEPYLIFEEEVPRSGTRVIRTFQRTTWYGGKRYLWLGYRKLTGRGEGSSGLVFDQIVDVEKTSSKTSPSPIQPRLTFR